MKFTIKRKYLKGCLIILPIVLVVLAVVKPTIELDIQTQQDFAETIYVPRNSSGFESPYKDSFLTTFEYITPVETTSICEQFISTDKLYEGTNDIKAYAHHHFIFFSIKEKQPLKLRVIKDTIRPTFTQKLLIKKPYLTDNYIEINTEDNAVVHIDGKEMATIKDGSGIIGLETENGMNTHEVYVVDPAGNISKIKKLKYKANRVDGLSSALCNGLHIPFEEKYFGSTTGFFGNEFDSIDKTLEIPVYDYCNNKQYSWIELRLNLKEEYSNGSANIRYYWNKAASPYYLSPILDEQYQLDRGIEFSNIKSEEFTSKHGISGTLNIAQEFEDGSTRGQALYLEFVFYNATGRHIISWHEFRSNLKPNLTDKELIKTFKKTIMNLKYAG